MHITLRLKVSKKGICFRYFKILTFVCSPQKLNSVSEFQCFSSAFDVDVYYICQTGEFDEVAFQEGSYLVKEKLPSAKCRKLLNDSLFFSRFCTHLHG